MNFFRVVLYAGVIVAIVSAWEYTKPLLSDRISYISNEVNDSSEKNNSQPEIKEAEESITKETISAKTETPNEKHEIKDKKDIDHLSAGVSFEKGFSDITKGAMNSVVNVATMQLIENDEGQDFPMDVFKGSPFDDILKDFFEGNQSQKLRKTNSLGSGFIVKLTKDRAYVVTNNHVVEKAKKIIVFLADKTNLPAEIYAVDPRTDLAVLSVDITPLGKDTSKLKAITWGDSDELEEGNWIIAIGNPFNFGTTVTQGIVSAKGRNLASGIKGAANSAINFVDDFIQHSASINLGNSGGCLLNIKGNVVGVNSIIYSTNGGNIGIAFAIPSNIAKPTVEQLIEHKRTFRGWLGAEVLLVGPEQAESVGLAPKTHNSSKIFGAFVGRVVQNSPAEKAGIKKGDIITEFDGKKISEKNSLQKIVGSVKIDSTVKAKVWRQPKDGEKWQEVAIDVKVGDFEKAMESGSIASKSEEKEKNVKKDEKIDALGISIAELPKNMKENYSEDVKVVVTKVDDASELSFSWPLFLLDDGIISANGKKVTSVSQFKKIINDIKSNKNLKGKPIPFFVSRPNATGSATIMLATTIDFDEKEKPENSDNKKNNELKNKLSLKNKLVEH